MPDNTTLMPIYRLIGLASLCYPIYIFCFKRVQIEDLVDECTSVLFVVLIGLWLLVNTDVEPIINKSSIFNGYKALIIVYMKWSLSVGIYVDATYVLWHRMQEAKTKGDAVCYKRYRNGLLETQILVLIVLCLYIFH